MASKKLLVYLVLVFALAVFSFANVNAMFGSIEDLEVKDVGVLKATTPVAIFAGEIIPVRVVFFATDDAVDVRVKAWISGDREFAATTERFDVIANNTYTKTLAVQFPRTLDENDLDEPLELVVVVENRNQGEADEELVKLTLQRESYVVEILDVDMANEVSASEVLTLDVVVKNRGRRFAEDNFVVARIPALELEDRAYFGDLSARDQSHPDKENAVERRLFLRVPSNAKAGVYEVEVEAFNDDSSARITKKVAVKGVEASTVVVAPVHSKSIRIGEEAGYSMTVVNSGNRVQVFELVIEAPAELDLDVSDPVVAIPAGSSKTITLKASSAKAGTYNFAVNVHSGSQLVASEKFTARVGENSVRAVTGPSPTVLLTVVLAIIFIVLLIVLIVLITRRPQRAEETGEGYY